MWGGGIVLWFSGPLGVEGVKPALFFLNQKFAKSATSEGSFPRRAFPHSLFKPLPQWPTEERGNVRK